MKRLIPILAIFLFVITGCGGSNRSGNDGDAFITVDVTKSYPKKELILQDFMEVEYIALETNDDFVTQGWVRAIDQDIILVINHVNDGNIYLFDKTGKGLRKFNRMGQGSEEYGLNHSAIIVDGDNNEIFVNDLNKVLVYDLFGTFKRSYHHTEGSRYTNMYNFDRESIICIDASYNSDRDETDKPPFVIISKQDGSIIKDIRILCQQKVPPTADMIQNGVIIGRVSRSNFPNTPVIPYHDSWILTVYSTDTIFRYFSDHSMSPFMVRTPSIQPDNHEASFSPGILTERYYFLLITKFAGMEIRGAPPNINITLLGTHLVYDRQEKAIYEYTVTNDDFPHKIIAQNMSQPAINDEIAFWQKIEAYELVEAYEKGQLKGKLKDMAAQLDAEDNPVIMLVKYKK